MRSCRLPSPKAQLVASVRQDHSPHQASEHMCLAWDRRGPREADEDDPAPETGGRQEQGKGAANWDKCIGAASGGSV